MNILVKLYLTVLKATKLPLIHMSKHLLETRKLLYNVADISDNLKKNI